VSKTKEQGIIDSTQREMRHQWERRRKGNRFINHVKLLHTTLYCWSGTAFLSQKPREESLNGSEAQNRKITKRQRMETGNATRSPKRPTVAEREVRDLAPRRGP
jgi:hypothetical protein